MKCAGPFFRERPTASTTVAEFGWCYLYLNSQGHIVGVEWI